MLATVLRQLRRILLTALVGGLLGATLVRLGPGFGVDERELDNRLSQASREAIRSERAADSNVPIFYLRYLAGLLHGNLGFSRSLNRPVSELLKERLPLTLGSLAYGVGGGISAGLTLALLTVFWRAPGSNLIPGLLAGACLALPAAVIALLFLWMNAPGRWAIALVVFPHVYRYSKNLLVATYQSPHVLAALGLLYTPNRGFSATAVARYVGRRFLDEENTAPVGGYTTLDANLGYRFGRYQLVLEGSNLTNQRPPVTSSEFGSQSFYLLPARMLWIRLNYKWL